MVSDSSQRLELSVDALVRSIEVNRFSPHGLFLGAGASISSGIPSAYSCIWEWKSKIFLSKHPALAPQFKDHSSVNVRQKIQQWLDGECCYPSCDSAEEYSFYAEQCYPIPQDRRQYFEHLAREATPYIGYQLLCLLAESGIIKSIWTTNFDNLVPRAATSTKVTPIEVGLDTTGRAIRQPREGELLCVALHGDYRYDALKNTVPELQSQDEKLREALIQHAINTTLIVSGYSGRDASVMEALTQAYSQSGTGRLYWCERDQPEPPSVVRELLLHARKNGREAYYISTNGFDDLLIRTSLACLKGELLDRAQEIYSKAETDPNLRTPFSIGTLAPTGLIKSNAFALEAPSETYYFKSSHFHQKGGWALLRTCIAGKNIVAALVKGGIIALGNVDEIKDTFSEKIEGKIERTPISERELAFHDSILISLFTQALVQAIATSRNLQTDKKRILWESTSALTQRVYGVNCKVHQAAAISLRMYAGKLYFVIKPTIQGYGPNGEELPESTKKELKRVLLTKQYNREFNAAMNGWRKLILGQGTIFEYPASGSNFRFSISNAPALAAIAAPSRRPIRLPDNVRRHVIYDGAEYHEPPLLFSNRSGDNFVKDTNPIRGIIRNRPYDHALATTQGFQDEVRLGVICPGRDMRRVSTYLNRLQQSYAANSKQEYLLDYPGFASAFGIPLDIPLPTSSAWAECPEPGSSSGIKDGATELNRNIINCIKAIKASGSTNVILIYIPQRWSNWEKYSNDSEHFDLHDFTKAYCVQQGIATQFLREVTLNKPQQCEVLWWLALSFYVKSMHTPWILEGTDKKTAFVGLGYSLDPSMPRGNHIILGCSHIYSREGLGLGYKLRKIEQPIVRQGNPFLSRDDARRIADGIRQLMWESLSTLPERVVIHKKTPFLKSEREGLIEGLSGVKNVEMLEINDEPALRYVASRFYNGKFQEDAFPIRRGTTVLLEKHKALVWVHGTTQSTDDQRQYYLGKSRIPAPLTLIRHHGTSSLSVLTRELLGLSKMNWNTFDMYTKVPATIQSSGEIARIGSLLERFGPLSYDYRLFI